MDIESLGYTMHLSPEEAKALLKLIGNSSRLQLHQMGLPYKDVDAILSMYEKLSTQVGIGSEEEPDE